MSTGLVDFFKYNLWANLSVLDACVDLDDTQLDTTLKGTYGSVRDTLVHIFNAEEGYVYRFTGQGPEPPLYTLKNFPGFDELRRRARLSGEGLIAIVEQFKPEDVLQLPFQGQVYDVQAVVVLIQAINHAIDHRSHIATLLSQQDITPPGVDGWTYYGEMTRLEVLKSKEPQD